MVVGHRTKAFDVDFGLMQELASTGEFYGTSDYRKRSCDLESKKGTQLIEQMTAPKSFRIETSQGNAAKRKATSVWAVVKIAVHCTQWRPASHEKAQSPQKV